MQGFGGCRAHDSLAAPIAAHPEIPYISWRDALIAKGPVQIARTEGIEQEVALDQQSADRDLIRLDIAVIAAVAEQATALGTWKTTIPAPTELAELVEPAEHLVLKRCIEETAPGGLPGAQHRLGLVQHSGEAYGIPRARQQLLSRQAHRSFRRTTCLGRLRCTTCQGGSMPFGVSTITSQQPSSRRLRRMRTPASFSESTLAAAA